jgi:hypothetical protein
MWRIVFGILLAMLIVSAVRGSGAAAVAEQTKCTGVGLRPVAAGRFVGVFRWERRGDPEVSLWACSLRSGRLTRLERNTDYRESRDAASPIVFAGDWVAYATDLVFDDAADDYTLANALNARTGKRRREIVSSPGSNGFSGNGEVRSIALRPNGAVAWIGRGWEAAWHLYRLNSRARLPKELDSGESVAARSLRLRGARLTWKHSRRTRSANLW